LPRSRENEIKKRGEAREYGPGGVGRPVRGLPVPVRDGPAAGPPFGRGPGPGDIPRRAQGLRLLFRRQAREAPVADSDLREHPDPSSFDGSGHWAKGPTDWGGNPADLYREKKFLDQLTKCLSGLSPNHANAFTLREIEGADTGEICKVLNVTETNLWVILHRARMLLRRCLEANWFEKRAEKGS
jgi:hypothetical protein